MLKSNNKTTRMRKKFKALTRGDYKCSNQTKIKLP